MEFNDNRIRFAISGALAGAASAFVFVVLHDIFISDIWFSLPLMLIAGALCGACLGWSYSLLAGSPSIMGWIGYNALYDAMFLLLALASVLVFQPMMPMAALMALNGPPSDLIGQAMPMTAGFTLLMAIVIAALYGFRWSRFGAVLLTSSVLILLLGLNVSVIGLVSIPRGSWYLVAEMLGLVLTLNLVYVLVFAALERTALFKVSLSEQQLSG